MGTNIRIPSSKSKRYITSFNLQKYFSSILKQRKRGKLVCEIFYKLIIFCPIIYFLTHNRLLRAANYALARVFFYVLLLVIIKNATN